MPFEGQMWKLSEKLVGGGGRQKMCSLIPLPGKTQGKPLFLDYDKPFFLFFFMKNMQYVVQAGWLAEYQHKIFHVSSHLCLKKIF